MSLSPAQAAILAAALRHPQHLAIAPARFAPAPRDAIRKSLLAKALIEPATVEAPDHAAAWAMDGTLAHYRLTEAGLRAAVEAAGADTPAGATTLGAGALNAPEGA